MSAQRDLLRAMEGCPDAPLWARGTLLALAPAGMVYGLAMRIRRRLYEAGIPPRFRAGVPVISVGNLTLGGTGKTPMVAWVVSALLGAGGRPAVVSRGYGGGMRGVVLVSDGAGAILSSPPAAEEAVMIARMFPTVPVVTGRDRPAAAVRATAVGNVDAIVLDDGFQHLGLSRRFDLVLLKGSRPLGNGRVFPAGPMREPAGALRRAAAIVLTGGDSSAAGEEWENAVSGKPVFSARLLPAALVDGAGAETGPPENLAGRAVVALSGIGDPEGFGRMLSLLGAEVRAHLVYPDHARYGIREAERALSSLRETGSDWIVTTEKDGVKLADLLGGAPLRILRVRMQVERSEELRRLLLQALGAETGR